MNSLASCHFILAPVEIGAQLRALEKGYRVGDGRDGDVSKKIFIFRKNEAEDQFISDRLPNCFGILTISFGQVFGMKAHRLYPEI